MAQDEFVFEDWGVEEDSSEPLEAPPWRRRLIIAVAALTATAMALVPLYNLIDRDPPVADNGLELCGFDYCIVQEGVRSAGLDQAMSRLANTYLTDQEARQLAVDLVAHLGATSVGFVVVDRLEAQTKGKFEQSTKTIYVERPVRAWIVLHEVAHTVSSGHREEFQDVVIELIRWLAP